MSKNPVMPAGWPPLDFMRESLGLGAVALSMSEPDINDDTAKDQYLFAQMQATIALDQLAETVAAMAWRCRKNSEGIKRT